MKGFLNASIGLVIFAFISAEAAADLTDLQAFMDEIKTRPAEAIEQLHEEQTYTPFTYLAHGLANPFYISEQVQTEQNSPVQNKNNGIAPDILRAKHFLEDFSVDSLTMVGVLSNSRANYALLRSVNGVHRVAIGDYLGSNHGRVTAITASSVEVTEIIADGTGGWLERVQTLVLQGRS